MGIVHGSIGTVYKGCIYLSGLHDIHGGTVHLQALLVAMSPLHEVIGIVVQTTRYCLLRIHGRESIMGDGTLASARIKLLQLNCHKISFYRIQLECYRSITKALTP